VGDSVSIDWQPVNVGFDSIQPDPANETAGEYTHTLQIRRTCGSAIVKPGNKRQGIHRFFVVDHKRSRDKMTRDPLFFMAGTILPDHGIPVRQAPWRQDRA
jgi:hypothetical protein